MRAVQQTEYRSKLAFAHSPDSGDCDAHSFIVKNRYSLFVPNGHFLTICFM